MHIAGCCQQTFKNIEFVDITQQCFALLPKANFEMCSLKIFFTLRVVK